MKANEAPERIWMDSEWIPHFDCKDCITENSVEYTRTDAFMKMIKEAFCKATCNGRPPRSTCMSLGTCREYDNFVKYMKGE